MPRLRLVPTRPNKLQLYYPFSELEKARLENARREAAADVNDGIARRRAAAAGCGFVLAAVVILALVYLR